MPQLRLSNQHHHHHWHYIYHRRKRRAISAKQIAIGQIIALSGSLVAGLLLELNKHSLGMFVGAFLLLPGVIDLSASITGAMCAKINHRIALGQKISQVVTSSVAFALMMSVTAGLVVGIFGGVIGQVFFGANFGQLIALVAATMVGVGLVAYPSMALLTVAIRKAGADPDNIIGPVETGFTDMLTVLTVVVLVGLFT